MTPSTQTDLITVNKHNSLSIAGQVANQYASSSVFTDYQERKSTSTLRRQFADLRLFADYLTAAGLVTGDFKIDPHAWYGITWGLVAGFVRWQLNEGYAVGSVNVRLATVKGYARLAMKAGTITPTEFALIMTVKGYGKKEARHIDERRLDGSHPMRKGHKKAIAVSITPMQADKLIMQPDSPKGSRDAFLMALLLDHGLRVGEVTLLEVKNFNLQTGEFVFYRPKVDKTQIHKMTSRTLLAAKNYFENEVPEEGCIWRASASKSDGREMADELTTQGISERAITKRVRVLGQKIGVAGLSAHDCRHHWASQAARSGTPIDRLQDAGGWSSPAMPLRYIESAKIANEGVVLSK